MRSGPLSRLVVALQRPGDHHLEHGAVGAAGRHDLVDLGEIEPELRGGGDRLGDHGAGADRDEVVDELQGVPAAERPGLDDRVGVAGDDRLHPGDDLRVAAEERAELARLGLLRRAPERAVDHGDAARPPARRRCGAWSADRRWSNRRRTVPGRMASSRPPPNSVASTSTEEGRQMKTTSLSDATSAGVPASRAPRPTRSSTARGCDGRGR